MARKQSKLTEGDREFVEDLSRKIILRAYLRNSSSRPRTLMDRIRKVFVRKQDKAPVVDIFKAIEDRRHDKK